MQMQDCSIVVESHLMIMWYFGVAIEEMIQQLDMKIIVWKVSVTCIFCYNYGANIVCALTHFFQTYNWWKYGEVEEYCTANLVAW